MFKWWSISCLCLLIDSKFSLLLTWQDLIILINAVLCFFAFYQLHQIDKRNEGLPLGAINDEIDEEQPILTSESYDSYQSVPLRK